jgi:GNAT superfamily N-acetyltransferase
MLPLDAVFMTIDHAAAGASPDVSVRAAADREARACRLLLPEMFDAHQAPELLVAVLHNAEAPDKSRLVGAAGIAPSYGPRRGSAVFVHVTPSFRRRGVGRALIEAAVASCRRRWTVVHSLRPVPEESQAAQFLAACGFEPVDRIVHFEVDGLPFYADMLAVRRRLESHRRIPPNVRIVRLCDADPDAVADLVYRSIETSRAYVRSRFRPDCANPYDMRNSVVLTVEGQVRGALIYNWSGGVPVIEVRAVDPSLRGSWANALMLEEATRNAKERGALRFRFFASDKLTETLSLARRANAEQIRIELQYARPVK